MDDRLSLYPSPTLFFLLILRNIVDSYKIFYGFLSSLGRLVGFGPKSPLHMSGNDCWAIKINRTTNVFSTIIFRFLAVIMTPPISWIGNLVLPSIFILTSIPVLLRYIFFNRSTISDTLSTSSAISIKLTSSSKIWIHAYKKPKLFISRRNKITIIISLVSSSLVVLYNDNNIIRYYIMVLCLT